MTLVDSSFPGFCGIRASNAFVPVLADNTVCVTDAVSSAAGFRSLSSTGLGAACCFCPLLPNWALADLARASLYLLESHVSFLSIPNFACNAVCDAVAGGVEVVAAATLKKTLWPPMVRVRVLGPLATSDSTLEPTEEVFCQTQ